MATVAEKAGRGGVRELTIRGIILGALITVLFTAAFRLGDPITPQVLQKLQPLVAILDLGGDITRQAELVKLMMPYG